MDIFSDFGVCDVCVMGKYYRLAFLTELAERVIRVFGLVYSDLCGFLFIFFGGKFYFIIFIDDFFRFTVVYNIRFKSVILECFKEYKVWAERQTEQLLKVFRIDNGGEYIFGEF